MTDRKVSTTLRTRVWVGLFVLVVFLAGLAAGVVAAPWLGFGPRPGFGFSRGGPGRPPMSGRLLERMSSRLDLTTDQTVRLEAVLDARRDTFRDISRDMRDRIEAERETFRSALAEILTTEQMETFEGEIVRMGEERRRRPGGRRERGGMRGPPR